MCLEIRFLREKKKMILDRNLAQEHKLRSFIEERLPEFNNLSWDKKKIVYEKVVRGCRSCSLFYDTKFNPIPNRVTKDSFALFIGRNPSKGEAEVNEILTQESQQGVLFNKYLSVLDLSLSEVSVLNMACCRGRGNRPPTFEEISICSGFKGLELELIGDSYQIIFAMGNDAMYWIFGRNSNGVLSSLGKVFEVEINGREVVVVPIPHPAHVLIDSSLKVDTAEILKVSRDLIRDLRNKKTD